MANLKELSLEGLKVLMQILNYPDRALKIIHVAGTNGKGSTIQFMRSILQQAGYKVGVFSSPHLINIEECITINGECIEPGVYKQYNERIQAEVKKKAISLTEFEVLTALSLLYFKDKNIDFLLLEVGLGGRMDATNIICDSVASVITKIAMDHKDYLGDTLTQIACEKAGIIKPRGLVITPLQAEAINNVIDEVAVKQQAELIQVDMNRAVFKEVSIKGTVFEREGQCYTTQMLGVHQVYNAHLAISTIEALKVKQVLRVTDEQIIRGIRQAVWPGRFQHIVDAPKFFIDGAHNVDGIQAMCETLKYFEAPYKIGIMGVLRDKEVDEMLASLEGVFDKVIVSEPANERALAKEVLADKLRCKDQIVYKAEHLEDAITAALQESRLHPGSIIIAFGSLYMIGHIEAILKSKQRENR